MSKRKNIIISIFVILLVSGVFYITRAKVFQYNQPVSSEIEQTSIDPKDNSNSDDKKNKINNLFSADVNLDNYRKQYNNDNIVARLEIPNMFNILIVQASDNDYYLNHSIDNKKDIKGTEYLDYRVNTDSKQINIYGHNSQTYDIPFRKLEYFLDKEYFDNNEYILLQDDNGRKIYHIYSIKEVDSDYSHMRVKLTGADFVKHVKNLGSNVIYKRDLNYDENSKILVLQTCSYSSNDSYYVITAILEE